ncbi:MAG: penicillin-binding protein 2, partial [Planctomycetaceae bacterium]
MSRTTPAPLSAERLWRRARLVVTVIGMGWMILAGRLVQLQWLERDALSSRATQQRMLVEAVAPRPGDILDRQGRLLATSVQSRSFYLVPKRITEIDAVSERLADALGISAESLRERLTAQADRQFLWVKRRLSDEEVEKVRQLELRADAWGFRDEYLREYPQGAIAPQTLGLRDIDGVGRGGVEEAFDERWRGKMGKRLLARDARGRVLDVLSDSDEPPQPGKSIRLTLDTVV